jgi:hypothetical protein
MLRQSDPYLQGLFLTPSSFFSLLCDTLIVSFNFWASNYFRRRKCLFSAVSALTFFIASLYFSLADLSSLFNAYIFCNSLVVILEIHPQSVCPKKNTTIPVFVPGRRLPYVSVYRMACWLFHFFKLFLYCVFFYIFALHFLYSNLAGGSLVPFVFVGKIISSLSLILDTVIVVTKWKT